MNLDPGLQLKLRARPDGPALMRHKWRDLTFLHFSVDPDVVQPLLQPGLSLRPPTTCGCRLPQV